MKLEKTLYDISWQVPESVYRKDHALSYSTLAKYEREGFDKLDTLFESISTPSLTLGSCVDTLITGSKDEFDKLFFVAPVDSLGDKEKTIADNLFEVYGDTYKDIYSIPFQDILAVIVSVGFYPNWREETRVKVITERCADYYKYKAEAEGKTVISTQTYTEAKAMYKALKESPATMGYFADNEKDGNIQRYYQLKFKHTFEGIDYRCMMDLAVVDYEDKVIIPCDLKTSGHSEWHFKESFKTWMYMIQASLYWNILRATMDEDEYFKDFKLADYRFIVVNKNTLTPLVWEFPNTSYIGPRLDQKEGKVYRDPFTIGKELYKYLSEKPKVPNDINLFGTNPIDDFQLLNT